LIWAQERFYLSTQLIQPAHSTFSAWLFLPIHPAV